MRAHQVIVLVTPVFLLLIAAELLWGWRKRRQTYRLADALTSISLGMLSEVTKVLTRLLRVGVYTAVYMALSLWAPAQAQEFWTSALGWVLALVFYDFCYYWYHRAGHEVAVFWAAHAVHHHSQDYNLSTALRQTSTGALLGWVFYLPMALAGVPPLVFGVVALVDLLYQFWVHTEHVPRLGWFDRWFCSPSNHRVHHAINDRYLDRNYGGILMVWDRLFGSFEPESEPCVYGTRKNLNSWDPVWANVQGYWDLWQESRRARRWADKWRVWVKPPGWRPELAGQRVVATPLDLAQVQRYAPPLGRSAAYVALVNFMVLLAGVAGFLWNLDRMNTQQTGLWMGALCLGLWAVGALLQGRMSVAQALMVQAAALTTVTAALDWLDAYRVFKPLVMLLALADVATSRSGAWAVGEAGHVKSGTYWSRGRALLMLALLCSLAGDVFLMWPGYFVPGLLSFLLAHLAYIALFKQGQRWFASRLGLGMTLAMGLGMYAYLWHHGLPAGLRLPVAAYVVVIALMAAQALGRASQRKDRSAQAVALGACVFILSDALLATNKFATPLPMAQLWVLATYYLAQILIVRYAQKA